MHRLSKETVRLVSSAQVITSPASVVKECLENSLDADATILEVRLEDYGFTSIIIKDNGGGVSAEDARLMAKAHYTSKITDHSDLESLATYGFRGEALSSIAAVARLSLETKTSTDTVGRQYEFDSSGEPFPHCPKSIAMTKGTTVKVHQLFEKLPVRREMYGSEKRRKEELKKIEEVVIGIAVGHPDLGFTLAHNKQVIWRKPKVPTLVAALGLALDVQAMRQLVTVGKFEDDVKLECCLPKPDSKPDAIKSATRSTDTRLFVFVNKRHVKFPEIRKLVSKYYFNGVGEESAGSKTPVGAVLITVQPAGVDVNLEPNKTRVLLVDEKRVFVLLEKVLEELYGPLEKPPPEPAAVEPPQSQPEFLQPPEAQPEPEAVVEEEVMVTSTPHFQESESSPLECPSLSGIHVADFDGDLPAELEKSIHFSYVEEDPSKENNEPQPLDDFTFSDLDDDEDFFTTFSSPPAKKPRTEEVAEHTRQEKQPTLSSFFTQRQNADVPVPLERESSSETISNVEAWAEGKALKDPLTKENVEPVSLFCPAGPSSSSNVRKKLDSASKLTPNTLVVGGKLLRKPPGPRELFEKEARKEILKESPDINFCDIGSKLIERWKHLDDSQRAEYHQKSQSLAGNFKQKLAGVTAQQSKQPKLAFSASPSATKVAPIANTKRDYASTRNLEVDLPLDMARFSIHGEKEDGRNSEEEPFEGDEPEIESGFKLVGALPNGFWIVRKCEDDSLAVLNHFRLAEVVLLKELKRTGNLSTSMEKHENAQPVDANTFTSDEWTILERLAERSSNPPNLDDERIGKNGLDVSFVASDSYAGFCPALCVKASIYKDPLEAVEDLKEIISALAEDPNCRLEKCRPAGVIRKMKEAVEDKMVCHPNTLNKKEMLQLLETAGSDKLLDGLLCPHNNPCLVLLGGTQEDANL